MISVIQKDGENFDRMMNRYRSETRTLRLQKMVRAGMFHQRNLSERKLKARAMHREVIRADKKRKMYY